MKLECHSYSI